MQHHEQPRHLNSPSFLSPNGKLVPLFAVSSSSSIPSFSTTSLNNTHFRFRDHPLNKLTGWGIGILWAIYLFGLNERKEMGRRNTDHSSGDKNVFESLGMPNYLYSILGFETVCEIF